MKIELKNVKNIRDFSGLVNENGEVCHSRRFIRSSALVNLLEEEKQYLYEERGLRTVIDLRTDVEAEQMPDVKIEGCEYLHMPLITSSMAGITREKSEGESVIAGDLSPMYRSIVSNEECIETLRKVFDVILHAEGTVLWHCSAGKDRCGIVSMLFLKLLGMSDEVIMEDYLKTNEAQDEKLSVYVEMLRKRMAEAGIQDEDSLKEAEDAVRQMMSAKERYLLAAEDEIRDRFGSMENYLYSVLKISEEDRDRLLSECFEKTNK